ncbi:MAG: M6 family metalloprotease domain-containing protein [bacterium]
MHKIRLLPLSAVVLITFVATATYAVMPPAPQEWFERIGLPMPEALKNGLPAAAQVVSEEMSFLAKSGPSDRATDALLLILVEFPDNQADEGNHPSSAYDDLMFSQGVIPTGSLREYYEEISYGTFSPAGTVTVWVEAPQPYSYYTDGNYGFGGYPNNSQGLLEDCVEILDPILDFSQFDGDGDGQAQGIFLVHAGPGAEETGDPNDIWSHAWYHEVATDDGVSTGRYSAEPEEHMDGSLIRIGVFCHEYGHVLGMPDVYDTDGSSEGVGVYCLMAAGSWGALPGNPERPTHMSAEMKRRLGWMIPVDVTGSLEDLLLHPAATHSECYRVDHPTDPDQYYLLEFRGKVGFDSLLRGDGGLAIWHVDWNGWQQDESHRYLSLEQADGNGDLERDHGTGNRHPRTNRGDAGDLFPGATNNVHFSFSTNPNSMDYFEANDIVTVTGIYQYGDDSLRLDLYATPSASIYRVTDVTIYDTLQQPGGSNFDNAADSGEIVEIVVSLAVEGTAQGLITTTLSSTDTRVGIIKPTGMMSIGAHGDYIDNSSDPFRVEVLSGNADSAVVLNLDMSLPSYALRDVPIMMNINRQKILVVLDNNGSNWSDDLLDAAYRSGYTFDLHNNATDGLLDNEDLVPYQAVLWTHGSYFGRRTSDPDYEYCLSTYERDVLSNYLDANGRLALFSQDYLYDNGLDAFAGDHLRVGSYIDDDGSTHVVGAPLSFLNGYDGLAPTWSFYDYTDRITPTGGAEGALRDDIDAETVTINYPAGTPSMTDEAVVFSTYAIERLDESSQEVLLPPLFDWLLTNTNIDVPLAIYPKGYQVVQAPSVTFWWTAVDGAAEYHVVIEEDTTYVNVVIDTVVAANSFYSDALLSQRDYMWHVSATPPSGPATSFSPTAFFRFIYDASSLCGDANGDAIGPDIADLVYLVNYMFNGGPTPPNLNAVDVNGDGMGPDIADLVYLVNYMFNGGPALNCP